MKPFPHGSTLTDNQKNFNYRLSRARIGSENAFGRLKARWRRLMKQNDVVLYGIGDIPYVQFEIQSCKLNLEYKSTCDLEVEDKGI